MTANKRNPFIIVIAILTIVICTLTLYITVFDQIISQNQGFFYAGVFGFILLLVFLLFNLFTKLIATSAQSQLTSFWKIASIAILIVFALFFLSSRLRLTSTLDANESNIYKSAVSMVDGVYAQNPDLVNNELINPSQYVYSFVLSLIFRILGASSRNFIIVNCVLYTLCGFFVYRIAKRFSDMFCALFSAFLMLIMPGQFFAVYSYNSSPIISLFLLMAIDTLSILYLANNNTNVNTKADDYNGNLTVTSSNIIIYTILGSVCVGLLILCEPVYIFAIILIVISAFIEKKEYALNILIALCAGIVLFVLLNVAKSIHSGADFGTVVSKNIECFNFLYNSRTGQNSDFSTAFKSFTKKLAVQEDNITDNFYYLKTPIGEDAYTDINASWLSVANQLLYMFLIVMACSSAAIALKNKFQRFITLSLLILGTMLAIFFTQGREVSKYPLISVFIIFCGLSINYLYLNHHPEQRINSSALDALEKTGRTNTSVNSTSVKTDSDLSDADFVKRARALIFIGNDEDLYNQIKSEEHRNAIKRDANHINTLEDTFDDYDDDFFLDKEDDVKSTPNVEIQAPNVNTIENISTTPEDTNINRPQANIPAWKQRPEKFGTDDMFFDDEDDPTGKVAPLIKPMTKDSDSPTVEVISRTKKVVTLDDIDKTTLPNIAEKSDAPVDSSNNNNLADKQEEVPNKKGRFAKADKKKKEKASKVKHEPVEVATNNGRPLRRVKTVGTASADEEVAKYLASREIENSKANNSASEEKVITIDEIPNPLPVPKKKEHKPIDYDKKDEARSGWDYDFDVDDDSDWDV